MTPTIAAPYRQALFPFTDKTAVRDRLARLLSATRWQHRSPEQTARIERARIDKLFFAHTYFHDNVPGDFTPDHAELMTLCDTLNLPVLICAFRRFGKSTLASFIDPLHAIVFQRRRFLVFGSYNQKMAIQCTKGIRSQLEGNPLLRLDFGDLSAGSQWQLDDFTTSTGVRVLAIGVGMSLRSKIDFKSGFRPDLVVLDDLESSASARSAYQSQGIAEWMFKDVFPAMRVTADGGASFRIIGTPITPVSMMTALLKDPDRPMLKFFKPILYPDGTSRWPQYFPDEELERIRTQVGTSAWHSEYLLTPLSSAFQLFDEQWLVYQDVENIHDWDKTAAACDPSSTEFGDFKSIIVMSTRKGEDKAYVRHVWCAQATTEAMLAKIAELQAVYDFPVCWIEDNALKEFLWKTVREYEQRVGVHLRVRGVSHSRAKAARIEALQSPVERGLIVLPPCQHSHVAILVDQMIEYPTGANDDAPDTLAEAYAQLMIQSRPPVVVESPPIPAATHPQSVTRPVSLTTPAKTHRRFVR